MNQPRNLAASVKERLLKKARSQREEFQGILTRYALERFLYRISSSLYRDIFILKGATLFSVWSDQPHRATQDLDLLGCGENTLPHWEQVFRDICGVQVAADGLEFKDNTIRGERIKEDQEYEGVRIKLTAILGTAKIPIQVDIGFGDVVTPAPNDVDFPTLLSFPAPHLLTYPRETVVAEKFQAMVMLGLANSRMKDFYDLWFLSQKFQFQGETLSAAIKATFERRQTPVPLIPPLALTAEFALYEAKRKQWSAFIRKGKLLADSSTLNEVVAILQGFLMPPSLAVAKSEPFRKVWLPSGSWVTDEGK